jgi:diacylglycerol kinase family enzyme
MKKYKVIANPAAGDRTGVRAIPQVEQGLARRGFGVVRTGRSGHGAQLAREAAMSRGNLVVAACGDGTSGGEILCVDGNRLEIELLPRHVKAVCQAPGGAR